jgi:hypothetical protein
VNLNLAPDDKHFAVLTMTETTVGERGSVHVMMRENLYELRRRKIVKTIALCGITANVGEGPWAVVYRAIRIPAGPQGCIATHTFGF